MKKVMPFLGAILLFAVLSLNSCGGSGEKKENSDETKSDSEKKEAKIELSKKDVVGEWFASGNGIKSKYIFSGDGSYTLVTEMLGDFSSDDGKWEINSSKSISLTTNFGNRSTANFSKDFSSFSANRMNYTK